LGTPASPGFHLAPASNFENLENLLALLVMPFAVFGASMVAAIGIQPTE
jgi:hypothetical protein